MGAHHAGGVAGRGALWLHRSSGGQRGCGPHPVLYLPCHLPRAARAGPCGSESRARTLSCNARCQLRQRGRGGKNENPARVWHLKREVARAGSRESSGGLGERGLHQAKHPAGGKYSAREGRYAGLFAVRLRVCAGLALDQSFNCDLRRIFRAPSQSLSASRSPSLASSMTNLASTTTSGSWRSARSSLFSASSNAVVKTAMSSGANQTSPWRSTRIATFSLVSPTREFRGKIV